MPVMHKLSGLIFAAALAPFCFGQTSGQAHPPSAGFQTLVKDAKTRIKELDADQLKKLQSSGDKFTLIDVREDNEWSAGHAAGALHIGKGVIERDIESKVAQKDTKLVLYCSGGNRSALAADSLMKMGYSNVFSLAGGLGAYKSAGLPIEKPEK
jgi:rhodanese-related sulfurtransferase